MITKEGNLFTINVETGDIHKYFLGQKFKSVKFSDSGNVFLVKYQGTEQSTYIAHKVQHTCVEPTPLDLYEMNKHWSLLTSLNDLASESFLSLFTGILQHPKFVKEQPKMIQNLLWKIFLDYPDLYVSLHSFYPVLEHLPPFSQDLLQEDDISSKTIKSGAKIYFRIPNSI